VGLGAKPQNWAPLTRSVAEALETSSNSSPVAKSDQKTLKVGIHSFPA